LASASTTQPASTATAKQTEARVVSFGRDSSIAATADNAAALRELAAKFDPHAEAVEMMRPTSWCSPVSLTNRLYPRSLVP
jgi:hypothetical protein